MIDLSEIPDWVLLLAPILVVAYWLMSRQRPSSTDSKHHLSSEYFTGLNYLLNDEQGKALDVFVKLVESDWEIIDTHFALGKIFRKNGETDKAIKIHQGLIARPSLPDKYRCEVLLELGYDYLSAGWFDRAEGLFKEVLSHEPDSEKARRNLILIYQQEKDWHKAIDTAVPLYEENPLAIGSMISQYYCELSDLAAAKGDSSQAEMNAKKALKYDENSVRSSILLAGLAIKRSDYETAIKCFEKIEKQDAEFIPVILDQLIECYGNMDKQDDLLKYMDALEDRCSTTGLLEKYARVIKKYRGNDAVIEYLTEKLNHQPSIQGMHHLLNYKSVDVVSGDIDLVSSLKSALKKLKKDENEYQCHNCGFQSNTLYWLCPSCQSWGKVKPALIEAA